MTQHVVATPSRNIPIWRKRSFLVVAGVVVLALGVGVAVRAIVASDSSTTSPTQAASTPAGPVTFDGGPGGFGCPAPGPIDGDYLLALIASSPNGPQIGAALSPQASQLLGDAVVGAATTSGFVVSPPDAVTLFGVLARLGAADRDAVMPLLPAEMQAELAGIGNNAQYLTCP